MEKEFEDAFLALYGMMLGNMKLEYQKGGIER